MRPPARWMPTTITPKRWRRLTSMMDRSARLDPPPMYDAPFYQGSGKLKDAVATHSYANSRDQIHPDLANAEERKALPPVRWRMNWLNPANGRRALYIASHAYAIDGMDDRDARQMLAELMDETTRRDFVYVHKWRPGDVVMWDNRAMLHRGRPWDYARERSMVRTTISATDADGLANVRPPTMH